MALNHTEFFQEQDYLEEFREYIATQEYTDRNPLNTEMYFLWSMIRTVKPELFIESGTFKGYSATIICEALKRNGGDVEFRTYGFNLENCLPYARQRLAEYSFAQVIEADSREALKVGPEENRRTAFFIDGPKGRNMPPLFFAIQERFPNIVFISVHDCERESGSHNRDYVEQFFGREFPIMYCDTNFQTKFAFLDEPLVGKPDYDPWRPYFLHGREMTSYGTETAFVLANRPYTLPFLQRAQLNAYRQLRFRVRPILAQTYRKLTSHTRT